MEVGGGIAKDEIDAACDFALVKKLALATDEEGVLPTEKAAVAKDGPFASDGESDGLNSGAVVVLKRDAFGGEVVAFDGDGCAAEGADFPLIGSARFGGVIEDDARFARIPNKLEWWLVGGDGDFFRGRCRGRAG